NALLSRFPILQYENQDVSDHRMEQRGLLHAVVDINETPVHCLVVHLGLFGGGRSRQVAALVERIKRLVPDDEPVLIAGDFNDWNNRLAPLFVQQLGLYEVFAIAPQARDPRILRDSMRRLRETLMPAKPKPLAQKVHELGADGIGRLTPPPRALFPRGFPRAALGPLLPAAFGVARARVAPCCPWPTISHPPPVFAELELA